MIKLQNYYLICGYGFNIGNIEWNVDVSEFSVLLEDVIDNAGFTYDATDNDEYVILSAGMPWDFSEDDIKSKDEWQEKFWVTFRDYMACSKEDFVKKLEYIWDYDLSA